MSESHTSASANANNGEKVHPDPGSQASASQLRVETAAPGGMPLFPRALPALCETPTRPQSWADAHVAVATAHTPTPTASPPLLASLQAERQYVDKDSERDEGKDKDTKDELGELAKVVGLVSTEAIDRADMHSHDSFPNLKALPINSPEPLPVPLPPPMYSGAGVDIPACASAPIATAAPFALVLSLLALTSPCSSPHTVAVAVSAADVDAPTGGCSSPTSAGGHSCVADRVPCLVSGRVPDVVADSRAASAHPPPSPAASPDPPASGAPPADSAMAADRDPTADSRAGSAEGAEDDPDAEDEQACCVCRESNDFSGTVLCLAALLCGALCLCD